MPYSIGPIPPGAHAAILSLLPEASLHALLATSKQLRQTVHDFVTRIHIKEGSSLIQLISWPSLTSLSLKRTHRCCEDQEISIIVEGCSSHLQTLDLSFNRLSPAAVQKMASGSWPSLSNLCMMITLHGPDEALMTACRQLAEGKWPALTTLDLSYNMLPAGALSQLVNGADKAWPQLRVLTVSGLRLCQSSGSVTAMSKPWTALQELDFSKSNFTRDDLRQLGVKFPNLATLRIGGADVVTQGSDGLWNRLPWRQLKPTIECLAASPWPRLVCLDLIGSELKSQHFQSLAQADCPQLTWLQLSSYRTDVTALSDAGRIWRSLKRLDLVRWCGALELEDVFALVQLPGQSLDTLIVDCGGNYTVQATPSPDSWPSDTQLRVESVLNPASEVLNSLSLGAWPITSWKLQFCDAGFDVKSAVEHLVKCSLSQLRSLALSLEGESDEPAVPAISDEDVYSICQDLARASWPSLETFTLQERALGYSFGHVNHISVLATSRWPLLENLVLTGHGLEAHAVQQLVHGRWPTLNLIDLRGNGLGSGTSVSVLHAKWPRAEVLV